MAYLHSQVGAIQNWVEHKQPKCKHTASQCAHDKLGNFVLANDPRLMANSKEYVAKLMVAVIKVAIGSKGQDL